MTLKKSTSGGITIFITPFRGFVALLTITLFYFLLKPMNEGGNYGLTSILTTEAKPHYKMLFIIHSGPMMLDRRMGVRDSYLKWEADGNGDMRHFFFVESEGIELDLVNSLREEFEQYEDLVYVPLKPSKHRQGEKHIWMIRWALDHFTFDHLILSDDDTFWAVPRLRTELPFRPKRRLFWAHMHCLKEHVAPDVNAQIYTPDVAEFLADRTNILCKQFFLGQNIGRWLVAMDVIKFNDYHRLSWHSSWSQDPTAETWPSEMDDLLYRYISLHPVKPDEMRRYYSEAKLEPGRKFDFEPITFESPCADHWLTKTDLPWSVNIIDKEDFVDENEEIMMLNRPQDYKEPEKFAKLDT